MTGRSRSPLPPRCPARHPSLGVPCQEAWQDDECVGIAVLGRHRFRVEWIDSPLAFARAVEAAPPHEQGGMIAAEVERRIAEVSADTDGATR